MNKRMNLHSLLLVLFLLPSLLPATGLADEAGEATGPEEGEEEEDEEDEEDEGSLIDDLASPYFLVGGGAGVVLSNQPISPEFVGRIGVAGGFYIPMLYLQGGLDVSLRESIPLMIDGYAALGIAVPTPVFHPLIGFKVGGGLHLSKFGWDPQLVYGPQIGWHVRKYNSKVGFRAVVEPTIHYFPISQSSVPEIVVTLSLVL